MGNQNSSQENKMQQFKSQIKMNVSEVRQQYKNRCNDIKEKVREKKSQMKMMSSCLSSESYQEKQARQQQLREMKMQVREQKREMKRQFLEWKQQLKQSYQKKIEGEVPGETKQVQSLQKPSFEQQPPKYPQLQQQFSEESYRNGPQIQQQQLLNQEKVDFEKEVFIPNEVLMACQDNPDILQQVMADYGLNQIFGLHDLANKDLIHEENSEILPNHFENEEDDEDDEEDEEDDDDVDSDDHLDDNQEERKIDYPAYQKQSIEQLRNLQLNKQQPKNKSNKLQQSSRFKKDAFSSGIDLKSHKKVYWSDADTQLLQILVEENGASNWNQYLAFFPDKSEQDLQLQFLKIQKKNLD